MDMKGFLDLERQEKWLKKFLEIIAVLKGKYVDVSLLDKVVTDAWVKKVYVYLKNDAKNRGVYSTPTFEKVNKERFYALQYFIHEVFQICFLEEKEIDFLCDNIDKDVKDECHAKALIAEYQLLEKVAKSFGYTVSFGTLFETHPLFQDGERQLTKDNDRRLLGELGINTTPIPSENKIAQSFFKELEKL